MFQLRLHCPLDTVDIISDTLMEYGALSVSTRDADAGTDAEQALFGEPGMPAPATGWQANLLLALFGTESQARDAASLLAAQDFLAQAQLLDIEPVPEQDWVRITQSQFQPVPITSDFWIVPSWHDTPDEAQTVIRLDPGVAFGTGTHPTTAMCLRWIASNTEHIAHKRVMDYGCGSGILAIAAALHHAARTDAVDIDTAAVQATLQNAERNGVSVHAQTATTDSDANNNTGSHADSGYDVVLANILATPLKLLAPLLCRQLAAGGHLMLSGILERQAQELQDVYQPYIQLSVIDTTDGWILMHGQKNL